MLQYDYELKFGELTPDFPYGRDVFRGMHKLFLEEYRKSAKGVWQLNGAEIEFGFFTAPLQFSKENALKKLTDNDILYGAKYPAMFFTKAGCWDGLKMVCLKMVIDNVNAWIVDPTRMSIRK